MKQNTQNKNYKESKTCRHAQKKNFRKYIGAEQELELLRRVDPEQHQVGRLRHPAEGPQDGGHLPWQLHGHPGPGSVACECAIFGDEAGKTFFPA